MISIQTKDFDVAAEYARLRAVAGDPGAIVTFTGLVREVYDQSRSDQAHSNQAPSNQESAQEAITSLTLEHYPGMTEKALQDILDKARQRWRLLAVRVIHRVGRLQPGDQIVLVGTASAHRQDAFEAAQYIMDYLKSHAPFWKKQASGQDSHWVERRRTDDDALSRWEK